MGPRGEEHAYWSPIPILVQALSGPIISTGLTCCDCYYTTATGPLHDAIPDDHPTSAYGTFRLTQEEVNLWDPHMHPTFFFLILILFFFFNDLSVQAKLIDKTTQKKKKILCRYKQLA